ncbi:hypothetical protein SKAU_G00146270 [Synaphobranchus kaupii]|uniref:Uncharacterized protein n=1 Tax=Synaphobranchus kaupii TaxID=118154 RepID=A0A9Q1J4H0_SYNKA|nr:hypothetical protein SKAU_G00146270 [Synaphobranchus kaupii]
MPGVQVSGLELRPCQWAAPRSTAARPLSGVRPRHQPWKTENPPGTVWRRSGPCDLGSELGCAPAFFRRNVGQSHSHVPQLL